MFFFSFSLPPYLLQPALITTALNAISEKRRSFIAGTGPPPTRPKSSINLHSKENVKLRERSTPRKPRPSSVATSMPSFMHVESPSPKMRSKSTDRINRGIIENVKRKTDLIAVEKLSIYYSKFNSNNLLNL